ncbi:MAG: gamma-butyrobetaine hydroxylase-like domain-containing protein [Ignavibacteria bacterium]
MTPVKINVKDKKSLYIQWNDKSESLIPLLELRKNCPCAICKTERQKRPASYIPLFSSVQLKLTKIQPVGTYAIQLFWADGHNTGIFSYDFLKRYGLDDD